MPLVFGISLEKEKPSWEKRIETMSAGKYTTILMPLRKYSRPLSIFKPLEKIVVRNRSYLTGELKMVSASPLPFIAMVLFM